MNIHVSVWRLALIFIISRREGHLGKVCVDNKTLEVSSLPHALGITLTGTVQAVMAEGKEHALSIGVTKMSTQDMYVTPPPFYQM